MARSETVQQRDSRIVAQEDTNLFGGGFTPFRDLWNAVAGDLGITTKRMRNDALARAAEEEAIWRDSTDAIKGELGRQRTAAVTDNDRAQLRVLETHLDLANRMRMSSDPKMHDAGVALLGKVTDQQRTYEEQQEAQRIARETQEASTRREIGETAWTRLNQVADDLRTESAPFLNQKEAWGRIKASMADPSEAGDYALLYSVHKMLDPASTVLASEFQNSQNLAGVPEIIVTARNQLREGERLTPAQRAAFVKMSEEQYRQSSTQQAERNGRYLERARSGGVPDELLESLQIPVFSPGDIPRDFGEADQAAREREAAINAAAADEGGGDSTARQVGDSIREGAKVAGGQALEVLSGMLDLEPEGEGRAPGPDDEPEVPSTERLYRLRNWAHRTFPDPQRRRRNE
jgi:hypothetical protein